MKKLILFFFIFITYNLFPQTWDLMYKEDFLYNKLEPLSCNQIIQKGDSTIITRLEYDNLIMIYDHNKKEWYYILKSDFWKCLRNDSLYNIYKESHIQNLFYDSKGNYWFSIPDTLHKITTLFKVTPDSTYIFNKIYFREIEDYVNIMCEPNRTIRNIKEDRNGNIWLFLLCGIQTKDSVYNSEYEVLCKFVNNRFETIHESPLITTIIEKRKIFLLYSVFYDFLIFNIFYDFFQIILLFFCLKQDDFSKKNSFYTILM